jgi:hypothetical protein
MLLGVIQCVVRLYHIFPHSHHRARFGDGGGGGVMEHKMCVLTFSTTFARDTTHSMKNSPRYYKRT